MANNVKRNDWSVPPLPPSASGSWRVTAAWHQEMAGAHRQRSTEVRAAWRTLLGCLAGLAVLSVALPGPGDLVAAVVDAKPGGSSGAGASARSSGATTTPAFLDTAQSAVLLAAGVIVWALLLWGLAVVAVAGIGYLPGAGGRAARKVLHHIAPAAAGRLVIAAVGVTAIAGVSGCAAPDGSAATVGVADAAAFAPGSSTDPPAPTFDIDWPDTLAGGGTTPPVGDPQPTAAPAAPASPAPGRTAPSGPTDHGGRPSAAPSPEAPAPPVATTPVPAAGAPAGAPDGSVTVQPGDTLWDIAARHLSADATDADIDTAWRAWYSANTELIGADPDLILPGQHLLPGDPETRPSP